MTTMMGPASALSAPIEAMLKNSANSRIFRNGVPIGLTPQQLQKGDVIEVGNQKLHLAQLQVRLTIVRRWPRPYR